MLKNLKLGKRFVLSFSVILFLFLIVSIAVTYNLNSISKNIVSFYNGPYQNTANVKTIGSLMESIEKSIYKAGCTNDLSFTKQYLQESENDSNHLTAYMNELSTHLFTEEGKEILEQIKVKIEAARPFQEQAGELLKENKSQQGLEIMLTGYTPIAKEAKQLLNKLEINVNENAANTLQKSERTIHFSFVILGLLLLVSMTAVVVICIFITKSITRPIYEIEHASNEILKGNLSTKIEYISKNELGMLAESMQNTINTLKGHIQDISYVLNEMAHGNLNVTLKSDFKGDFNQIQQSIDTILVSFHKVLRQIQQSTEQVADGAGQMSEGAQEIAQGATQQAATIQELASAVQDISIQINHTASNTMEINDKTTEIKNKLNTSNQCMEQLLGAMLDIDEKSSEIQTIIKTIEDISFQTNILAINAAVEAARAGESGKGFSVVAGEVRNLANRSAQAAKDTVELIKSSLDSVKNGMILSQKTALVLKEAVEEEEEISETIEKVSKASNEQANSVNQLKTGIEQISAVVQTNSATAEQSAATSEQLNSQAELLKIAVEKFQLSKEKTD